MFLIFILLTTPTTRNSEILLLSKLKPLAENITLDKQPH